MPNALSSDIDQAIRVFRHVNELRKDNAVQVDEVYAELETDIKTFLDSPAFLKKFKDKLPTSDTERAFEDRIDFRLSLVRMIDWKPDNDPPHNAATSDESN